MLAIEFSCRRVYQGAVSSIRTLNVEEVATALRVARRTVYALLAEGALPVVRIGRAYRVDVEALRRFVKQGGRESLGGRKREARA